MMESKMNATDGFQPEVVRGKGDPHVHKHILNGDSLKVRGEWTMEVWRAKTPKIALEATEASPETHDLVHTEPFRNSVVNAGANSWLGIMFHGDTQITSWYAGLVDNASFSAFNNADTMGSHAGWIESTIYAEANRVQWSPGSSSGRSITNGTAFTFTMNSTGTIHGAFICSDNTKGGTSGTLWATGAFTSNQSVTNGDLIKLVYTVSV